MSKKFSHLKSGLLGSSVLPPGTGGAAFSFFAPHSHDHGHDHAHGEDCGCGHDHHHNHDHEIVEGETSGRDEDPRAPRGK